jgi:hypothetical protein
MKYQLRNYCMLSWIERIKDSFFTKRMGSSVLPIINLAFMYFIYQRFQDDIPYKQQSSEKSLAIQQSYGFFDDIDDEQWKLLMQHIAAKMVDHKYLSKRPQYIFTMFGILCLVPNCAYVRTISVILHLFHIVIPFVL